MEEKKNTQEKAEKLSYEKLNQMAGELYQQNQRLTAQLKQMQDALDESEFNKLSFLISMLFKVIEHRDAYSSEFVVWCIEKIEDSLKAFYAGSETESADEA